MKRRAIPATRARRQAQPAGVLPGSEWHLAGHARRADYGLAIFPDVAG